MSIKSDKEEDRIEAIETLRTLLKAGDTVHTIVRHRSRSNMSRVISLGHLEYSPTAKRCDWRDLSALTGRALDLKIDREHLGVKVGGVGMNMCKHVVWSLSKLLFDDSYALKQMDI